MAKDQNLSLNPTKISGVCGRLMCCLNYEDDLYKKTEQLKECSKKSNSLMAVGAAWRENFYEGLDKLLTESEHNMYIDKSEYYRKAGIERRKF